MIVKVAEYRSATDRLFRIVNVDYHACVGVIEVQNWQEIAQRVLTEVEPLECKRATAYDHEQFSSAVQSARAQILRSQTRLEELRSGAANGKKQRSNHGH